MRAVVAHCARAVIGLPVRAVLVLRTRTVVAHCARAVMAPREQVFHVKAQTAARAATTVAASASASAI